MEGLAATQLGDTANLGHWTTKAFQLRQAQGRALG